MGERPDRPDDVRRDPLGGDVREPGPTAGEPGFDPATDAFEPDAVNRDPGTLRGEAEADEVEQTRTEIERTRSDMSETVDAIQERLSPQNLKEQAKDSVREATVGKAQNAGSGLVETIRANPLPAALTGIGLGWLLVSARRSGSSGQARYRERTYAYPPAYDRVPPDYDYAPSYEEERGTSGPSAGQALERARDRVGETATQAQDRAGQAASQAQDRVGRLGDRARYQAQRASGGFQRMLRENPLAVGALAVGAGAAVGLAIPQTGQEHEAMGEARDTLVEKAQEKAQDAQQRARRVAEEAQSAAKEEAENQGLTNE
jgi:ElaB/YqjD/DUF883 family membrane-anchored ribosome-binding protein